MNYITNRLNWIVAINMWLLPLWFYIFIITTSRVEDGWTGWVFSIFLDFWDSFDEGHPQKQQQHKTFKHFRKQHPKMQLERNPIKPTKTNNGTWRVWHENGNPFLSTPITDSMGQWCPWVDMSTILFVLVVTLELLVASKVWRFPTDILGNCGTSPRTFRWFSTLF